jgi:hypothetical protein
MLSILRVTTVLRFVPGHVTSSPHFVFFSIGTKAANANVSYTQSWLFLVHVVGIIVVASSEVTVVEYFAPVHAQRIECLLATPSAGPVMAG